MSHIDEICAFVFIDAHGNEAIGAAQMPSLGTMPLIGSDQARIAHPMPVAEEIGRHTGRTRKLVKSSWRDQ
jgi:hypothetical protein